MGKRVCVYWLRYNCTMKCGFNFRKYFVFNSAILLFHICHMHSNNFVLLEYINDILTEIYI